MIRRSLKHSSFLFLALLISCASLPDKHVQRVNAIAREEYYEAKEACRGGLFGSIGVKHASYKECMRKKGWRT